MGRDGVKVKMKLLPLQRATAKTLRTQGAAEVERKRLSKQTDKTVGGSQTSYFHHLSVNENSGGYDVCIVGPQLLLHRRAAASLVTLYTLLYFPMPTLRLCKTSEIFSTHRYFLSFNKRAHLDVHLCLCLLCIRRISLRRSSFS
jgi:hypothetical protein